MDSAKAHLRSFHSWIFRRKEGIRRACLTAAGVHGAPAANSLLIDQDGEGTCRFVGQCNMLIPLLMAAHMESRVRAVQCYDCPKGNVVADITCGEDELHLMQEMQRELPRPQVFQCADGAQERLKTEKKSVLSCKKEIPKEKSRPKWKWSMSTVGLVTLPSRLRLRGGRVSVRHAKKQKSHRGP